MFGAFAGAMARAPLPVLFVLCTAMVAYAMGPPSRDESASVSIGRTNRGRLLNGVALTPSSVLQVRTIGPRFGLELNTGAAQRIAERVAHSIGK